MLQKSLLSKRIIVLKNVFPARQLLLVVPTMKIGVQRSSIFMSCEYISTGFGRAIPARHFHQSFPKHQKQELTDEEIQVEQITRKIIANPIVFDKYLTLKIKLFEHGFLFKKGRSLGSLFSFESVKKTFDSIKYLMSGDLKSDIANFYYVLREEKLFKDDDDLKIIATALYRDDIDELVKQLKSNEFDDIKKQESEEARAKQ